MLVAHAQHPSTCKAEAGELLWLQYETVSEFSAPAPFNKQLVNVYKEKKMTCWHFLLEFH